MGSIYDGDFGVTPGTAGASTGFLDNFDAIFAKTSKVDSFLAFESSMSKELEDAKKKYEEKTGEKVNFDPGNWRSIHEYTQPIMDPENTRWSQDWFLTLQEKTHGNLEALAKFDEQLKKLQDPSLPDVRGMIQKVSENFTDINKTAAEVGDASTFGGTLGGFVGGIAGSFTLKDPLQLAMLPAGGFGKSIGTKMLTEAAVGGVTEAIQQKTAIQPTYRALGLKPEDPFWPIVYSSLGAGLLRGGFEGIGKLFEHITGRLAPPPGHSDIKFDFNDPQLKQMFENTSSRPESRAAHSLLDENQLFEAHNPYPNTEAGARVFSGDVAEVTRILFGDPDTAIAHIGPTPDYKFDTTDLNELIVKEKAPEVYTEFVTSKDRLAEVDNKIEEVSKQIDGLSQVDAIRKIDEPTADLVSSLQEDLRNPETPMKRREEIQHQLNTITETLGPKNIDKALNDATIAPRKELRSLRQSRKAAKRNFTKAEQKFNATAADIAAKENPPPVAPLPPPPHDLATPRAPYERHFGETRHESLDVAEVKMKEAVDSLPDTTERAAQVPVDEDGYIDLGNGSKVLASQKFEVDGKEVSAAEVFTDLQNDIGMLEAMRTCSL